ncbi:helix-turn-helix domain-containing protein [Oceanobacillus bengalensis]|uniref:DNA-binding protein n=1 Tax=Oceanobacillus bengalensis TaxID=1435466 RepID=A0A494Z3G8_9BACI|nr:helix-turn-helix domain-containing protein [Oceanobacillus bengalensis]RKQ17068.1 DNA-binding protein [Oceanobacillus bengalensis]
MERYTMTVKEVADYIGLHTDTIYDLVRENKIPHFRIGRKILFTKETIDNWVLEQVRTKSEQ